MTILMKRILSNLHSFIYLTKSYPALPLSDFSIHLFCIYFFPTFQYPYFPDFQLHSHTFELIHIPIHLSRSPYNHLWKLSKKTAITFIALFYSVLRIHRVFQPSRKGSFIKPVRISLKYSMNWWRIWDHTFPLSGVLGQCLQGGGGKTQNFQKGAPIFLVTMGVPLGEFKIQCR